MESFGEACVVVVVGLIDSIKRIIYSFLKAVGDRVLDEFFDGPAVGVESVIAVLLRFVVLVLDITSDVAVALRVLRCGNDMLFW